MRGCIRFYGTWEYCSLKPGFHIVVSVVSVVYVVRKKFIGQIKLYGNLPYKCSIQKKLQIQLVVRDRINSMGPTNFFRTTDTTDTTDTTIWKPGFKLTCLLAWHFTLTTDIVPRLSLRDSKECCVTSLKVFAFQKQTVTILNFKGTYLIRGKCNFRGYMRCYWGRLELLVCITFTLDLNISSSRWAELFSNIKSSCLIALRISRQRLF